MCGKIIGMKDIFTLIEQGQVKRYFRARNKFSFEGAVSHLTQHAAGKEPLFLEESDYLYMLHLMKERSKIFNFSVLSFTLMLNHIHLLIKFGASNMAQAMKNLFEKYANYFNNKYGRKGRLFSGAYRSALCFDESYLLASSLYIHLNAVKANIVTKPIDYRWSSCALFLREINAETFVDYKFVLSILDEDISRARMKYADLLKRFLEKKEKFGDVLEKPNALGLLVRVLKDEMQDFCKEEGSENWAREHGLLGDADLEKRIEELKAKKRFRQAEDKEARRFLIEQLKSRGFSIDEIAQRLNLTRQTIYNSSNK